MQNQRPAIVFQKQGIVRKESRRKPPPRFVQLRGRRRQAKVAGHRAKFLAVHTRSWHFERRQEVIEVGDLPPRDQSKRSAEFLAYLAQYLGAAGPQPDQVRLRRKIHESAVEIEKQGVAAWIERRRMTFAARLCSSSSVAERRFGRRNFMELYAVFSSPQNYSVETTAGQPLGTLSQGFVDRMVELAVLDHSERDEIGGRQVPGDNPWRPGWLPPDEAEDEW